ncbi:VanZ family protein [Streptococcus macacae]|uniref:VanZ-like protein n=1 Tax=Streptococcus macacae NCTC 11558 TaxID=764298 RepID=G5JVA7_9STRE|nr:VanZ family protein [Streptococcus macacae]EHJ52006.1 VanZ-like protein [Streptococcus macacae NCTC 11558]SUN77734.1 membrane protein [Streptococcus macacae NCTC 11558]
MITHQKYDTKNLLIVFFSFILSKWFYDHFLISYSHYISNYGLSFALGLNIIITFILTYFTYVFLKFCQTRQIQNTTIISCYMVYGLTLIYLLFLKNIGSQGLILNPLSFIRDISHGSRFVPFMNLVMFIPLGFLFSLTKLNLSLTLLGLVLIESCQYVFHLGVLDLGDITLNLLSIIIGSCFRYTYLKTWIQNHIINKENQIGK